MTYDSTNGASFQSSMFASSPTPATKTIALNKNTSREIVQAKGSPQQLLNAGGLAAKEVNIQEFLSKGIDIGLPNLNGN